MRGICFGGLALLTLALPVTAFGQTYEELQKEVQELRTRNAALSAALSQTALQAPDDRPKGAEGVIVSYDPASTRLVVKVGDRERTIELKPGIHVHDENDYEVRPANRAEKLKPGVKVTIVEEDGQVIEINLGAARKHDHKHDHEHGHHGEWVHVDPFYKGWHKPSDDYRSCSWKAPESEGFCKDLFCGQFVDTHRSPCGTPWVHPFTIEPAHLHRDLYFIYKYAKDAEGGPVDEHELEVHLDWALTRRFGILIGTPFLGLIGPDEQAAGFGDLEIGPRIVLVESDAFFLTANILVTIPTGDEERDLGAGETVIAPFLTTWNDLGTSALLPWRHWNTMFLNVGPEYGVESGDGSLSYTAVFLHSFLAPKLIFPHSHGNGHGHGNGHAHGNGKGNGHAHDGHAHDGHAHNGHGNSGGTISVFGPGYPPGMMTLHLEFNGQSELQDDRLSTLQLLTGFSYELTESLEFRFGVEFPLNHPELQFDALYSFAFGYFF